jgi:hypothetical protein
MSEMRHTKGPWRFIIDDTGGPWSGWPLSICPVGDDDRTVVRTGGQWPYEWDAHTSQAEAVANARLIAAAPELLEALKRARDDVISLLNGRGCEAEGAEEDWVGHIDAAIARAERAT